MKLSIGAVAVVAVLVTPLVGAAQEAALSANVGFLSEYYYRGIPQGTSSANGGLDFTVSKIYVGAWAADVAAGNEVDVYAGVGHEWDDFSVSVGGTGYFYTDDAFDNTYLEGNLNVGYDFISAEFSYGTHRTDPDADEYWFLSGTVEQWGLFATFGMFGDDADGANHDGEYYEAGYGASVGDFDVTASWLYSTDTILTAAADDHVIIFGISYAFDIDLD